MIYSCTYLSEEKVNDLTSQVESLCDELDDVKYRSTEETRKLKLELEQHVSYPRTVK